jgi:hypothetical protein
MSTLTINIEITDNFILDIIQANIDYTYEWFVIDVIEREKVSSDDSLDGRPVRIRVHEYNPDDGSEKPINTYEVGPDEIKEGIRRVLTNDMNIPQSYGHVSRHVQKDLFEALLTDDSSCAEADIILQAATIGHVKYA